MTRTGQLSRMHARGQMPRRHKVNRDPLRKVIGDTVTEDGYPREELECGHLIVPPRDFIGDTYAARRRCWQCAPKEEAPG